MMMRQFGGFSPDSSSAWVDDYKKLSRPLQDQLDNYALAANAWVGSHDMKRREAAYPQLQAVVKKLPADSKILPKLRELLADGRKAARARSGKSGQ